LEGAARVGWVTHREFHVQGPHRHLFVSASLAQPLRAWQ
jgi:hypothetical protein